MKAGFAIALLAISMLRVSAIAQENTAEGWVKEGQAFYKNESYAEALEAFEKAIEINPQNSEAWVGKGKSMDLLAATTYTEEDRLKSYEDALQYYDTAIKTARLDHDLSMAWSGKALGLDLLGRKNESIQAYDKAVELDPKNAEAWLGKGVVLLNQAFITDNKSLNLEGERALDKALEADPQDPGPGPTRVLLCSVRIDLRRPSRLTIKPWNWILRIHKHWMAKQWPWMRWEKRTSPHRFITRSLKRRIRPLELPIQARRQSWPGNTKPAYF